VHAAARLRGHGWPDGRELSGGAVSGSPAADPSRGGWRSSGRGCSGRAGCCSPRQRRCERYQRPAAAARCRDPGACRSSTPPCLTCSRHRGPPNPPAAGPGRPPGAGCARLRPIRQSRHVGSLISQSRSASGLLGAPQKAQPATIPPPLQPPRGIATRTGPRSPSPVGSVHHPACLDKPRILRSPPSTSGDTTMGSHLREELAFQSTSMPQGEAYASRGHCCIQSGRGALKQRQKYRIRSPGRVRRTRRSAAGYLAPRRPVRSDLAEGSGRTRARRSRRQRCGLA
jgi:hypothetical protein